MCYLLLHLAKHAEQPIHNFKMKDSPIEHCSIPSHVYVLIEGRERPVSPVPHSRQAKGVELFDELKIPIKNAQQNLN